jgi:hypothetical protein
MRSKKILNLSPLEEVWGKLNGAVPYAPTNLRPLWAVSQAHRLIERPPSRTFAAGCPDTGLWEASESLLLKAGKTEGAAISMSSTCNPAVRGVNS